MGAIVKIKQQPSPPVKETESKETIKTEKSLQLTSDSKFCLVTVRFRRVRDVGFPVAFLVRFLFLGGVGTGFGVDGFFLCWFFGFFFW